MRRVVSVMWVLTIWVLIGLTTAPLFAAEPTPAPAKTEAKPAAAPAATPMPTPQQAASATSKTDATESEAKESPESAKNPSSKGPSPQRFTPSEQVRADFDVSFPIDI